MNDRSEIIRVLTSFGYFRKIGGHNTVLVTKGNSISNSKFREVEKNNTSCFTINGWEFFYSESTLSVYNDLALIDTNWDKCKSLLKAIDQIADKPYKNQFRLVQVNTR